MVGIVKPWEPGCEWYVEDVVHVLSERRPSATLTLVDQVATFATGEDARLAAAAPDLVRALLVLREDVDHALADDHTDETARVQRETIDAALMKAGALPPAKPNA